MRTLLYTGQDDAYKALAAITVPRMAEYADRRGMDFTCYTEPLIDVPNGIYWTGVCGALRAIEEGYKRAIYLDVDQLVTNYAFDIDMLPFGLHIPRDWGEDAVHWSDVSACCLISHKNVEQLLKDVLALEPEYRDEPFPEQLPLRKVIQLRKHSMDWTRKPFNCVPDAVCPGKVPEPWVKGDWCAHLTMVDLPRRIEIAKEILASL